ncbi:hypothetical protein TNCV_3456101 [Trichonephila clavipes]|nr:hypothetical protein TNCV_3456101 [Trichonephila clavipes]
MDPTCQQGTVQDGGGYVMVWNMCNGRDMGTLIRLDTTLTGDRYKRYLPRLTPTYLWTALSPAYLCGQLPPALLQTLMESMPRHVETLLRPRVGPYTILGRTATAGSDVVQSGRPIFDDFFQHLWSYIGNNTANVVFQMVKRLWLIRIDQ